MKLILRKNDSVTSLLLYLYNTFRSLTGKDDISLAILLEIATLFEKTESTMRVSLSRAVKAGVLVNKKNDNEITYILTEDGKQSIMHWNAGMVQFWKRFFLRHSQWDGSWHVVNLTYPPDINQKNDLLDKLQQLGFASINAGTWVSPYQQLDEVGALVAQHHLENKYVSIIGELTVEYELSQLFESLYSLDKVQNGYENFLTKYQTTMDMVKSDYKREGFVSSGQALPLLHELGWQFFNVASNDPVLPVSLNPHGIGDHAAREMQMTREMLLSAIKKYLFKLMVE